MTGNAPSPLQSCVLPPLVLEIQQREAHEGLPGTQKPPVLLTTALEHIKVWELIGQTRQLCKESWVKLRVTGLPWKGLIYLKGQSQCPNN